MITTTGLTKTTTTIGFLYPDVIVDGYRVGRVQHRNDSETRFQLGGDWTPWRPSTDPISWYC